ncbi:MAG: preprotein translocase subunit SecY [Candidatus Dojkabacteria bacterium]
MPKLSNIKSLPKRSLSKVKTSLKNFNLFKSIKKVATNKEILQRIGITLLIVVIYRGLAQIPLPGVDMTAYKSLFENKSISEVNYLFTVFTGGRLETPSIVGLGLAAYINASIIMQILPYAIQRLKNLQQEGERGQQAINQITRFITFPLAFIYSLAYVGLISQTDFNQGKETPLYLIARINGETWPTLSKVFFMALILAAGTVFLMWLSEIVTEKGMGNGSSVVISIGILSSLPALIKIDFDRLDVGNILNQLVKGNSIALTNPSTLAIIGTIIGFIFVVCAIVFINESQRRLPIQYARRVRGADIGRGSNLPIKFTVTGVMPVIFAYALLSLPQLIIPLIEKSVGTTDFIASLKDSFLFANQSQVITDKTILYDVVYFSLIVIFGLFYAFIVLNPKETSENLQKSGAFIPGVRPGKSTENYLTTVLIRVGFIGSFLLAIIAIIPVIGRYLVLSSTQQSLALLSGIGGTSVLILVGVLLDTKRQYDSLRATKNYQKFVS